MNVPEIFGSMVFNEKEMKKRLSKESYTSLKRTMVQGSPLEEGVANEVASAMKDWAIEKGATHYSHWFQPLTGITAEKHEGFPRRRRRHNYVFQRQRTYKRRARRIFFSFRRQAFNIRSQRLHSLGSNFLPICKRPHPLHPYSIFFLHRRSSGQKNTSFALHGKP